MKHKEFYIGWQPKAPQPYAQKIKRHVILLALLIPVVAILYAYSQKGFNNGVSELGTFSEVTGVMYESPVPRIRVEAGPGQYRNFLMVGFGKSDVNKTLGQIKKQIGDNTLENYQVTINAEYIYYDGRTILEVPAPKNTQVTYQKLEKPLPPAKVESMGQVILTGEIVDSKCYFGLMKPGSGKIHRSCGVRCIAGGIPPILVLNNGKGQRDYILVQGPKGEAINQEILEWVGLPIQLKGQLEKVEDWLVLKADLGEAQVVQGEGFESVYFVGE